MTSQAETILIHSAGEPPAILAPDAELFQRRARRFEQLAEGHSLGDWLRFLAILSRLQHEALQAIPAVPLPDAAALARAREHRMPPLPAQSWPRDFAWHAALRHIATALRPAAPESGQRDLARLAALPADQLETLAERVLHTELYGDDAALLPYVGAALQVYWTALAQRMAPISQIDVPGVCPCCGFLPVASIVKTVGETANLRYLHCALCNTEWNLVRVKCAACDSTAGIAYRELAGDAVREPGAVRAETCDECKSYLKIVYQEKGGFDPIADDLATLALDILVDEAGYARAGPNLLLVPGG
jgi:FdhE protein